MITMSRAFQKFSSKLVVNNGERQRAVPEAIHVRLRASARSRAWI
jgi:hypothetical protein